MPMSSFDSFAQRVVSHKNALEVLAAVISIAIAWIVGKGIAGGKFGFLIMVGGLIVFLVAYFRRHSIVVLFPIAISMPNIGLDIPGPWAITVQDAFVLLTFSGYLTRRVIQRKYIFPRDDRITPALFLFWGVAVFCITKVALVSPDNLLFNLKELMRLTMLVLFYIVMIDVLDSKKQLFRLIGWLLVWAVWMMGVSVYIYLTLSPFWYYILTMQPAFIFLRTKILRMVSIAGSTSYTGIYYATILALATHFTPLFSTKLRRMYGGPLIVAVAACILLTFNRGTWVGILLGLFVLVVQGQIERRRVTIALLLGAGIIALMTTSLFGQIDVEQQVVDFLHYSRSSAQSRLVRWVSAVNVILDHPFLGVGYNNYAFVYGRYSILEGIQRLYGSPHNMYIDVITGTGILGFVVFMTLITRLWRQMVANMKAAFERDLKLLSRGIFTAFLFFLGSGLFDSFLFKPHHSSYLIVAIWAMSTALVRLRPDPPPPTVDEP
jgi:O-antigen ligase